MAAAATLAAGQLTSTKEKALMIRHEYAEVNGVRLHYAAAGSGKLILFLHGFPEFWYAWKDQLVEFGRDHLAVAPDMRGYNLSSKPADIEQYRIKYLVEDVRALSEKLGHERFTLVGHDWGGAVAWAFAIRYPARLEKLVIINAPHPAIFQRELAQNPDQRRASQYMLMFRSPQAESILSANNYAALLEAVLSEGLKRGYFTEEDKKAYLQAWSQPGALTGGLNYYRASRVGPDINQEARPLAEFESFAVRVPTLVIWGEKDTALLTGNLNGLEEYVPNLTVKRISDGSHWVVHEKPELINGLIRGFISSQ
jgi:pimeloyl-ACP methyl ester carboxylesterase